MRLSVAKIGDHQRANGSQAFASPKKGRLSQPQFNEGNDKAKS
jgi:hypothetical protein